MPLAGFLSGREQRSNADFRLYLLTFTKAATVCDSTVTLETIPSEIFEKQHICQCGLYPFTDCWGLKHENRFKPFTSFWISIGSFWLVSYSQRCQWVFKSGWASSNVVGIICPLVVIGLTELPNSHPPASGIIA